MKFNYLLRNLIFCAAIYNIKVAFKAVHCTAEENTVCGDVNTRLPVVLPINRENSTNQYDYIATENKDTIIFEAKCNFAFQSVLIMPSKFGDSSERENLYEAESPSTRAYKVTKTTEGENSRVEIHLLNGEVVSLVKSPPSTKYVRESDESESLETKKRLEARRALLYSVFIILTGLFSVVIGVGTLIYLKKRRMGSDNNNRTDIAV
ncbi:Apical membrane antigen 1 [Theileria orientalis]|uniref:Apical membrane antigen 1 n=1 Tax=Theileria orientalis TaxID=68886 RepID=A0A976MA44_THEOR|nr:Apical membrane antigen 1 [Theileria orientalis]